MDGYLRQSTASQVRTIGAFVDDTDFKTLKNALSIANTDILIKKNGAASAAKNSGGATADGSGGMYHLTWDATDTATVGQLFYSVKVAGSLVVFGSYTVLEEAVYDALFASSAPGYVANAPVNVAQFGGSNGTFASGRPEVNLSHIAGSAVSTSTAQLGVNVVNFGGSAGTFASGRPEVNTSHWAGTAVGSTTVRADVINIAGSGVSASSGLLNANVTQVSGDSAAADNLERWFDGTVGFSTSGALVSIASVSIDATSGAALTISSADGEGIRVIGFTSDIVLEGPGSIVGNLSGSVGSVATNGISAASLAADAGTEIGTAVWATTTRQLTSSQTFSLTGDITGNLSGSVGSVTGNVGGNVTGSIGSVGTGGITAASIADGAIDRATFAADTGLQTIRSNTAQDGGNTTITLDASASAVDDFYNNAIVYITGGTGVGQSRTIEDYVGSTKVATVATWGTNPVNGSTFAILPAGLVSASVSSSDKNDIVDRVWDEATSGHGTAGTTGAALTAAGSAGDPWSTLQPGPYAAGTFGYLISTTIPGLLTGVNIIINSATSEDGQTVTIRRGDDRLLAIGTEIEFEFSGLPFSLTGATVTMRVQGVGNFSATVASATSCYVEMDRTVTNAVQQGSHAFELDAVLSGGQHFTLVGGGTLVVQQQSA